MKGVFFRVMLMCAFLLLWGIFARTGFGADAAETESVPEQIVEPEVAGYGDELEEDYGSEEDDVGTFEEDLAFEEETEPIAEENPGE